MTTLYKKTFEIMGSDLKRMFAERAEFEADRTRDNSRLRYMAHAGGYVMVRHPRAVPFAISEKEWRELPLFR